MCFQQLQDGLPCNSEWYSLSPDDESCWLLATLDLSSSSTVKWNLSVYYWNVFNTVFRKDASRITGLIAFTLLTDIHGAQMIYPAYCWHLVLFFFPSATMKLTQFWIDIHDAQRVNLLMIFSGSLTFHQVPAADYSSCGLTDFGDPWPFLWYQLLEGLWYCLVHTFLLPLGWIVITLCKSIINVFFSMPDL